MDNKTVTEFAFRMMRVGLTVIHRKRYFFSPSPVKSVDYIRLTVKKFQGISNLTFLTVPAAFCNIMHSSRKYPATEGNGNFEGRGVPKGGNIRGGGGCLKRFFPGGLNKVGELLMKNSFSVEQAIIYFTVTVVSKQVLSIFSRTTYTCCCTCWWFYVTVVYR